MQTRKPLLVVAALGLLGFAPLSYAVPTYSATFGGLTFTFTQTGGSTLDFEIAGTPSDTDGAGWSGVSYLGAFNLKDLGEDFTTTTATANGPGATNLVGDNSQLSASNVDCSSTTGETGSICFDLSPDYALPATPFDLTYTIDFTNPLSISSDGPHLQILFLDSDHLKQGSLYSQNVPMTSTSSSGTTVPEPSSSSLALLGLAFLGFGMWTRRRRAATLA